VSKTGPASDGAIQPIGFLVALAPDWRVSRVSANAGDYLGKPSADLLGLSITSLFANEAVHSLRNRLALLRSPDSVERLFGVALTGGRLFDVALHMSGNSVVIEAEPSRDHGHDHDSTGTVRGMIAQLASIDGLPAFFAAAARQMRALTGFDRVVIERHGPGARAKPEGEAVRSGARAAMRTPPSASDLALGLAGEGRTILTLIADTGVDPVAILAPARARPDRLDLGNAMLLAAPAAGVSALRDAGVGAAIFLPLVVAGRQWGGIACYHHAPSCPSVERRNALEWFAMMLAMQIEIRELRARL